MLGVIICKINSCTVYVVIIVAMVMLLRDFGLYVIIFMTVRVY
jgi:hypothetical protein